MSEKNKKKKLSLSYSTDGEERLIPDEDEEFERQAAEKYRDQIAEGEAAAKDAEKRLEQQKRAYEQKLRQDKIAMMKEKQGIADDETEEADAEDEEPVNMSFWKKVENFWYHYKIVTIIVIVVVAFGGYMIYDLVTKVNPDITIIVTADNGLMYRADAVEKLFEKYAEDVNGDGKVNVEVIFTPMNSDGISDQYSQGNETKLAANLSNARCVLYLTDDDSYFSIERVPFDDLTDKFDSKYVTADGISFDSDMIREGFNWAQMPDDMILKVRTPVSTMYSSDPKDMQETYDNTMSFIENLVAAMDEYDNNAS